MNPKELSEKAHQLVAQGAVLVDVRTPDEYRQGHPPAARNIPLQDLPRRLAEVGPPGTQVVVYCQMGGRATKAADFLRANGYPDVFNLLSVNNWL
jgi:rhodanese-related sulfurtransferase